MTLTDSVQAFIRKTNSSSSLIAYHKLHIHDWSCFLLLTQLNANFWHKKSNNDCLLFYFDCYRDCYCISWLFNYGSSQSIIPNNIDGLRPRPELTRLGSVHTSLYVLGYNLKLWLLVYELNFGKLYRLQGEYHRYNLVFFFWRVFMHRINY